MRVTKILSYQNPSVGFHLQVKHKHLPLRDVKLLSRDSIYKAGGGGGYPPTLLQEVMGDLPLDGVAISRLEWL